MNCSKLNAHLYSLHVVASPGCSCGYDMEDNSHYLLKCPLFYVPRTKMLTSIARVIPVNILIDVNMLLSGCDTLSNANNTAIFHAVHCFIEETARL